MKQPPEARCALPRFAPLFAAPEAGARAVCLACPLVVQCAYGALERGETWGVWGGLDMAPTRPHRATDGRRSRPPAPCGTPRAWRRHERLREPLDDACRLDRAAYAKARYAARQEALSSR